VGDLFHSLCSFLAIIARMDAYASFLVGKSL
jgi:hypothetical protein